MWVDPVALGHFGHVGNGYLASSDEVAEILPQGAFLEIFFRGYHEVPCGTGGVGLGCHCLG